jgi:hypothetical protein
MAAISSVNSAALLILQQANSVNATESKKSGSDNLLAVANGLDDKIGVTRQPTQAQSKISESIFSVNRESVNKLKLDLIDRTGKALGVAHDDYASKDDFVDAMQKAFGKLKLEGGDLAVKNLEAELGLDKLGLSILDVIQSARDPQASDKVTKALEKQSGNVKESDEAQRPSLLIQPDEIGLYGAINL